ncbi:MAG: exo-alpha-sialidase [Pirellulales bacterium]|nr:exo-alpha-sialidase [Pirellulales bacterium]
MMILFARCPVLNVARTSGAFLTVLLLLAGVGAPVQAVDFFETEVFQSGTDGYHNYRIPAIVRANDGTLLAFAEGRKNNVSDSGDIDLVLRRSFDNGLTWDPMQVVWSNSTGVAGNPCPVVDESTGDIILLTIHETPGATQTTIRNGTLGERVYQVQRSTDVGTTWTDPVPVLATEVLDPRWQAGGPNHGIQLTLGEHAGRLIVAGNHSTGSALTTNQLHVLYSDDHGATWNLGTVGGETPDIYVSEVATVELLDERLYFTVRDQHGPSVGTRAFTTSSDAGMTFDAPVQIDPTILAPVCHGSILRYSRTDWGDSDNRILQSYPFSSERENIYVRSSFDEAATWTMGRVIYEGSSAYSDLVRTADDRIGLFYERDNYGSLIFASFTPEWLDTAGTTTTLPAIDGGTMLGFWKLNDGAGQIASDASSAGRHGRLGDLAEADDNDPEWVVDPERGTVLSFSGTDYVDLSQWVGGLQDVQYGTISLWMKTTSVVNQAVLAASDSTDQSSEIRMMMEDAYTMWFDVRDDSSNPIGEDGHVESQTQVNDGQWHFVTATVEENNRARVYVDGVLEGFGTEPFFVVQTLDTMALGRNVDLTGPQWHYDGLLSDVAIFDRPLSATMVRAVYELDQDATLGYDTAESIGLFLLELGDSVQIDGLTWFALGGLPGEPGQLVEQGGQYFLLLEDDGTGVATVPGLLPGDANFDGVVNRDDAAILATNWLHSGNVNWTHGDFNGDHIVDDLDASILAAHWLAAAEGNSVPEPSTWILLAAAAASLLAFPRRRRRK